MVYSVYVHYLMCCTIYVVCIFCVLITFYDYNYVYHSDFLNDLILTHFPYLFVRISVKKFAYIT